MPCIAQHQVLVFAFSNGVSADISTMTGTQGARHGDGEPLFEEAVKAVKMQPVAHQEDNAIQGEVDIKGADAREVRRCALHSARDRDAPVSAQRCAEARVAAAQSDAQRFEHILRAADP